MDGFVTGIKFLITACNMIYTFSLLITQADNSLPQHPWGNKPAVMGWSTPAKPNAPVSQRQWECPWGAFLHLGSWKDRGAISCRGMENGIFHLGKVILNPHSQVWQETSCASLGLSYHFPSLQEDPSSHLFAFCMECPRLAPGFSSFCTLPGVEGVRILGMSSFTHWAFLVTWSPAQKPYLHHQKLRLG